MCIKEILGKDGDKILSTIKSTIYDSNGSCSFSKSPDLRLPGVTVRFVLRFLQNLWSQINTHMMDVPELLVHYSVLTSEVSFSFYQVIKYKELLCDGVQIPETVWLL